MLDQLPTCSPEAVRRGLTEDLTSAAHGLWRHGKFLKVVGYVIVALAIIGALYVGAEAGMFLGVAVMVAIVGLAAGAGLHALGTFFAAAGEGMLAIRDTAMNTGRAAAALQARAGKRRSR